MNNKQNWRIQYVLPNIKINTGFESDFIAIVPIDDKRVVELMKKNEGINTVLNGFLDDYKRTVKPAVLIFDENAPETMKTIEAFVSYRNILAISVICFSWANLNFYNVTSPMYSDTFDFYPILFGNDGSSLTSTPAMTDFRSKKAPFLGTQFRGVPIMNIHEYSIDKKIYEPLLNIWSRKYLKPTKNTYASKMLFRSLELAYHALAIPRKNEATINDYGTAIGDWVSSFEILAHKYRKKVNINDVLNLLNKYPKMDKLMSEKRYVDKVKGKKHPLNLLEKLYVKLYTVRHDFLHGNYLSKKILRILKKESLHNNVLYVAAPLYRILLYSFLFDIKMIKEKRNKDKYSFLSMDYLIDKRYNDFFKQIVKPEVIEE